MSVLTRSQYNTLYNSSGSGTFLDNSTQAIVEASMRQFAADTKDSFFNLTDDKYSGAAGIYLNITDTTGLKAITTVGISLNFIIFYRDSSGNLNSYKLVSGTDAESLPLVVRPTDYDGSTNQKVWKLAITSSGSWLLATGGTRTGINTISGTTPSGLIFTDTWTAAANNQFAVNLTGTVTSRNTASDVLNGLSISYTMARNAGNPATQIANAVLINPTFSNTFTTQNILKLQSAGTDRMVVTSVGDFGLGITPLQKAHIFTNGSTDNGLRIETGSSTQPGIQLFDGAGTQNKWLITSGFASATDGVFLIYDLRQSQSRFTINTSGVVAFPHYTTANGILYTDGSGVISQSTNLLYDNSATSFTTTGTLTINAPASVITIVNNASTNTALTGSVLRRTTSGTAAIGIGINLSFQLQNDGGSFDSNADIRAISTAVTAGSPVTDLAFFTLNTSSTEKLRITGDGRLYGKALHNNAGAVTGTTNQYIASGTYTATLTNTTNITSSTASPAQWMRVGNVVTVSGSVLIQPTAGGFTLLRMSLPIASTFVSTYNLGGTHNIGSLAGENMGTIYANACWGLAEFQYIAVSISSTARVFTFTYVIL